MKATPRTLHGFTLIELLTVIVIVGILAALIIPTVGKVRENAKSARSVSNLRQCAAAMMLYASDRNGMLPAGFSEKTDANGYLSPTGTQSVWQQKLYPYIATKDAHSLYTDPNNILNSPYHDTSIADKVTYNINTYLRDSRWSYQINKVPDPSRIVLVGDVIQTSNNYVRHLAFGPSPYASSDNASRPLEFRHAGKTVAQFAFVDGHVGGLTAAQALENPASGSRVWYWW